MKNTVKIRITKMEYKRNCENFCNTVLMLRKARNIGDEETVNQLRIKPIKQPERGQI